MKNHSGNRGGHYNDGKISIDSPSQTLIAGETLGLDQALDRLQARREEMEFEMAQWRAISDRVREELARSASEKSALQARNRELADELKRTRQALERSTDENLALKSGLSAARKQIDLDRAKMGEYAENLKATARRAHDELVQRFQNTARAGQTTRDQLVSAHQRLQAGSEKYQRLLLEVETSRRNAQQALQSATQTAKNSHALQEQLRLATEKVRELTEVAGRLDSARRLAQDEVARFSREYVSAKELKAKESEILELRKRAIEEIHSLRQKNEQLQQEIGMLTQRIAAASASVPASGVKVLAKDMPV